MAKRNSPNDIKSLDDLNDLENIVVDKRIGKRQTEKRNRRDRHYNKLFIKVALKDKLEAGDSVDKDSVDKDDVDPIKADES